MQIGHINFGKKLTGKRSVGKPHAAFDVEGDGNGARLATAPLLDPTLEGCFWSNLGTATRRLLILWFSRFF